VYESHAHNKHFMEGSRPLEKALKLCMGLMPTLEILYRFKNPWKIVKNLYGSNTSHLEKYLLNLKFELFNLNKDLKGFVPYLEQRWYLGCRYILVNPDESIMDF